MSTLLLNITLVFLFFWVTVILQSFIANYSLKVFRVTKCRYLDQAKKAYFKAIIFLTIPFTAAVWLISLYALNLFDSVYISITMFFTLAATTRTLPKTYKSHIEKRFRMVTYEENGSYYNSDKVSGELTKVEKDMLVAGVGITSKSVKEFEKG